MAHGILHKNTDIKMIINEANQEKEFTHYMRIGRKKRIAAFVDEIILSTDEDIEGKTKWMI
jgi:DNA topoisomerase IA